jgi:hypothetical protein
LCDAQTGRLPCMRGAAFTNQAIKSFVPFYQALLADIELEGDAEGALTRIDEALVHV